MAKNEEPIMGAEDIKNAEESYKHNHKFDKAKEAAQRVKDRTAKMVKKESDAVKEHPIRQPIKRGLQYVGLKTGIAAIPTVGSFALVTHGVNKQFKKEYGSGMISYSFHNAIDYTKSVHGSIFASETDRDYALKERKFANHSGIKFQKTSENARTTVLSWFGLEEEAASLNQRDEQRRMEEAHHAEMEEMRRKHELEREKMMRSQMLPMAVAEYFRNPMVARYWANRMQNPPNVLKDSDSDGFFDTDKERSSHIGDNDKPKARSMNHNESPETKSAGADNEFHDDEPIDGEWTVVEPDDKPTPMYQGLPMCPVDDTDTYTLANLDPEVLDEYMAMQEEFAANIPSYEVAIMNSRKGWKDIPDATMVEQMKTLQNGAYLNYMMASVADGSIMTAEDIENHRDIFNKQWAEFENDKLMPMYGDRIRAYMAEKNHEPTKSDTIMIEANERKIERIKSGVDKDVATLDAKKEASKNLEVNAQENVRELNGNALTTQQILDAKQNDQHIVLPEEAQGKFDWFPDVGAKSNVQNPAPVVEEPGMPVTYEGAEQTVEESEMTVTSAEDKSVSTKKHRKVPSNIAAIEAEARNLDSADNYLTAVRNRDNMQDIPSGNSDGGSMQYDS